MKNPTNNISRIKPFFDDTELRNEIDKLDKKINMLQSKNISLHERNMELYELVVENFKMLEAKNDELYGLMSKIMNFKLQKKIPRVEVQ